MKINNAKCFICSLDFYKKPSLIKEGKRDFCSKSCLGKYNASVSTAKEFECCSCQKKVWRTNNQRRNSKKGLVFCSNECKNPYISKDKFKDKTISHRHKIKQIKEKYKNTCQNCSYDENEKMLDIHHIDENHFNNKDENLILVCVWCHYKHHRNVEKLNFNLISLHSKL